MTWQSSQWQDVRFLDTIIQCSTPENHSRCTPQCSKRSHLPLAPPSSQVSALVTGEFYSSRNHFPGFGSPFFFNALLLLRWAGLCRCVTRLVDGSIIVICFTIFISPLASCNTRDCRYPIIDLTMSCRIVSCFVMIAFDRVGRATEARDAARIALRSPWWTLSATYQVRGRGGEREEREVREDREGAEGVQGTQCIASTMLIECERERKKESRGKIPGIR